MKVWANAPGENWICDRIVQEFKDNNPDIWVSDPYSADVIWIATDFAWNHVPYAALRGKPVVTTIAHIVPSKMDSAAEQEFALRDSITTLYHCYNQHSAREVRRRSDKPIELLPYWANQFIWTKSRHTKDELREKHGLPIDAYIVGSFQRDTEGDSIASGEFRPKLEKGADLLAAACEIWADAAMPEGPLHVLLAGWRRQYIMKRLDEIQVPYTYFELPSQEVLCELYQCCDLYPVTARQEGGPQAFLECGLLGTPMVSRDVGIASQVLPPSAIHHYVTEAVPAVPDVESMKLPHGFAPYRKLFESLM